MNTLDNIDYTKAQFKSIYKNSSLTYKDFIMLMELEVKHISRLLIEQEKNWEFELGETKQIANSFKQTEYEYRARQTQRQNDTYLTFLLNKHVNFI